VLVRSRIDLSRRVLLWLSLRSVGAVPAYDNGVDAGEVPAYTDLDATLRWEIRPGVEWLLIGRNLLHDSHPEIGEGSANRHEVERSIHTMIRWDF
jgi:iron complex outermembrane receptor protein